MTNIQPPDDWGENTLTVNHRREKKEKEDEEIERSDLALMATTVLGL